MNLSKYNKKMILAYPYLQRAFADEYEFSQAILTIHVMWMLQDIATICRLTVTQHQEIAEHILDYYEANVERGEYFDSFSYVVGIIVDVLEDDPILASKTDVEAYRYLLNYVRDPAYFTEAIQENIMDKEDELMASVTLEEQEGNDAKQ